MKLKLGLLLLFFPTLALAKRELTSSQGSCKYDVELFTPSEEANASMKLRTAGDEVIADIVVTANKNLTKPLVLGKADLFLEGGAETVFRICDQDYSPIFFKPQNWDRPSWQNMDHEGYSSDGKRYPLPFESAELVTLKPGETIKTSISLSKFYPIPPNWNKLHVLYETNELAMYAEITLPQAKILGAPIGSTRTSALNVKIAGTNTATYQYAVVQGSTCDGATYSSEFFPLTTKITASLGADGPYTLCVKGKSTVNDMQRIPTQKSWTKDTVAPTQVTLAGTPANPSTTVNLNVTVSGADVAKYRAALKNGTDCASAKYAAATVIATPITLAVGAAGPKTLCVKGIDATGNVQTIPTAYSWTQN